ncbi:protein of unknown function [Methylorubrum extorquens]|uniref:Uncharacterized protein n=1 Tax=Methylorubrum extorquens TaxID=408 RepID=A0A2N9AX11_METEX|nr:protein of unknown function [Methylorubrum extorquens]
MFSSLNGRSRPAYGRAFSLRTDIDYAGHASSRGDFTKTLLVLSVAAWVGGNRRASRETFR